jgi:hypothetical protein
MVSFLKFKNVAQKIEKNRPKSALGFQLFDGRDRSDKRLPLRY